MFGASMTMPWHTVAAKPERLAAVNHFYAVLDAETADAIETSPLLNAVASVRVTRTTPATGRAWTGRYIDMRTTYVELFGPGDIDDGPVGSIGLGLGGDTVGEVEAIAERLRKAGASPIVDINHQMLAGRSVDWYHVVVLNDVGGTPSRGPDRPSVSAWAMEYVPSYFDQPEAGKLQSLGPEDLISRRRYNAANYRGAQLADLALVKLAMERDAYLQAKPLLEAANFAVTERSGGVRVVGAEISIDVMFTPATAAGLREIVFHLARPEGDRRTEKLGRSLLVVGPGRTARWTFVPRGMV